jgi:hypothetical protein
MALKVMTFMRCTRDFRARFFKSRKRRPFVFCLPEAYFCALLDGLRLSETNHANPGGVTECVLQLKLIDYFTTCTYRILPM